MKNTKRVSLFTVACAAMVSSLSAAILHEFNFDEPGGTLLTDTVNTGLSSDTWHEAVPHAVTTGTGNLRVTAGDSFNTRVNVGDIQGAEFIYFVTEFSSWSLSESGSVSIRLSLMNNILPDTSSQISAEARFRMNAGQIEMQAQALSGSFGGESSAYEPVFPVVLNDPLTVMVAYSKANHEYGVYFQSGDDPWEEFFFGSTATNRDAGSMRLVFGGITGDDFIDIDRIYMSTVNPIPEPQTYALLIGFGALGLVLLRRRNARP